MCLGHGGLRQRTLGAPIAMRERRTDDESVPDPRDHAGLSRGSCRGVARTGGSIGYWRSGHLAGWQFTDWAPAVYSIVRFTLCSRWRRHQADSRPGGVPDEAHEHVYVNRTGF
jgi:hypothetical protein